MPSLIDLGVSPAHAKTYAEAIGNGSALLLVETPLGTAAYATEVLGAGSSPEDVHYQGFEKAGPAPLSSLLGLLEPLEIGRVHV